jgi:hypothetical protein
MTKKIKINADDLGVEKNKNGALNSKAKISISTDDLKDINDTATPVYKNSLSVTKEDLIPKKSWSSVTVWQNFGVGALGGFLAWLIQEVFFNLNNNSYGNVLFDMGFWFGVISLIINVLLGAWEAIVAKNSKMFFNRALISGAYGFGIGFASGILAQILYGVFGGGYRSIGLFSQIFARTIGWTLAGVGLGVTQGLLLKSKQKIRNGILGGAIGGFVGGLLFDFIGLILSVGSDGGLISRMVGITAIGSFSGLFISLVDDMAKEAWLKISYGKLKGKEYILYNERTIIGAHYSCDIVLSVDIEINPKHCLIQKDGNTYSIKTLQGSTILVNSRQITAKQLQTGDRIKLGNTELLYIEKKSSKKI